jgi:hypothetical protein
MIKTCIFITLTFLLSWAGFAGEVRFDFESGDLQGWKVVEGTFARTVTDRAAYHNGGSYASRQGKYHLSTVEGINDVSTDAQMGVSESPVFVLEAPEISFLQSGGSHVDTYIALCTLDGKEHIQSRGKNSEVMTRIKWSLPNLLGQKVFFRIVDGHPSGWGNVTCDDFTAQGTIDLQATAEQFAKRKRVLPKMADENIASPDSLRAAIQDLMATFGNRYPNGKTYLARLDEICKNDTYGSSKEFMALQREAMIANPLVSDQPLLYIWRNQYKLGGFHAIDTLFHTCEANTHCFQGPGAMRTVDLKTGKVTTLVDAPNGIVRDPDVHFDGKRILFSMRRQIEEDFHIWEINTDGTGLRQLTRATNVSDVDPLYLPDDRIAFTSTREPKYNQCSRDIGANIFCMESDGANIHQIGKNNLFDNQGTLTPEGQILYARWEYVDRNFGDAHGIWTVNPDGVNQALYWGNNTASPAGVYYPKIIPGSDNLMCIFGMHHFRMWGALAIVDRRKGIDGQAPVVRTWPADAIKRVRTDGFDADGFISVYPKYECPFPLSEKYFLCSRMTLRPGQKWIEGDAKYGHEMGIYMLDVFGNETLIHLEEPGCYDPMPLKASKRPPVIPRRRDFENKAGYFYVTDVYEGTHMKGVKRGTVKYLRVVEVPEKRHWSPGSWNGQGYTAPGMNWHSLENKRILGTVPVEEDGSAYFEIPSEKFVYFQLLDANGMMVQSMRSGASVQSGERAGCIGCHDDRLAPPPSRDRRNSIALGRAPSQLTGWRGVTKEFSFMEDVQPVFTKHCVSCHDYGKKAGQKLNLAPDRTLTFNTAYMELWRKKYVGSIGAGPAEIQQAYSWGSHVSRLVKELRTPTILDHKEVKLSAEELERIVTWVDVNGVYYSTYACAYPDSQTGRTPLTRAQFKRLSELTGWNLAQMQNYAHSKGPEVSFERPEWSPCIQHLDKATPQYQEALDIIKAGMVMLTQRPRADMLGFQPCEKDIQREAKYEQRRQIELRNREAIRNGQKMYDE